MRFKRAFAGGGKVDQAARFVDTGERIDHPLAARQPADQPAVAVVQIQMLKAIALRGPDEAAGIISATQWPKDLVQIDPYVAGFLEQQATLAGARVEAQQIERSLRTVLDLRAQAAI